MSYAAVTLADLQTQLAARVDSHPWWTADQARLALNEGLRIWNAATGTWVTKALVDVAPNDPYLPLPSQRTPALRLLWNGRPLEKASLADLDYGVPNWRSATTDDALHPSRPSYWAPVGLALVALYPAAGPGLFPSRVEVSGLQQTPLLLSAGDFVDLGQEQHDVLLDYALHVLTFSMGGQRFTATADKWLAFLQAAGKENQQFAATQTYRRLLGLDVQRWRKPQTAAVENPVDQAAAAVAKDLKGE